MKKPHDIAEMMRRIRHAVEPFAKAALFELAEDGFTSPFEQLVACLISIRTRDEATLPVARKLFARARTPVEVNRLEPQEIDELIRACTFHERKAYQIHEIARQVVEIHNGELPCKAEVLLSLGGVGPKCANLVLGIACGQPRIGVDIHVHRVTNRWGYVEARTPEKTTIVLEARLPHNHWIEINELLVPFGKHICTGTLPRCSECPVLEYCEQVGVTAHR
jgi:endonuclease-3